MRNAYEIFVVSLKGKDRRSGLRWEDNIKVNLREMVFGGVDWIHLAQNRVSLRDYVNTVMNIQVP
jgi:hypothetical protein